MSTFMRSVAFLAAAGLLMVCLIGATPARQGDALVETLLKQVEALLTEVAALREHIADLEARLAALEEGCANGDEEDAAAEVSRRMRITSIGQQEPQPIDRVKVREVKDKIAANDTRIARYEKDVLDLQVCRLCTGLPVLCRNERAHRTHAFERRRKAEETNAVISRLKRENTKLNGEVTRLERAAGQVTQIIHGTDGEREYVLYTESDMTRLLSTIDIGTWITWRGRILYNGETRQEWSVNRIEVVPAPSE